MKGEFTMPLTGPLLIGPSPGWNYVDVALSGIVVIITMIFYSVFW
jgi:hypothetical protein